MARIVEAAWRAALWWGLFIWVSAVTGARRGEGFALQWCDIDLEKGLVRLDENYVTSDLLRLYKADCARQLLSLGIALTGDTWGHRCPSVRSVLARRLVRSPGRREHTFRVRSVDAEGTDATPATRHFEIENAPHCTGTDGVEMVPDIVDGSVRVRRENARNQVLRWDIGSMPTRDTQ